MIDLLLPWVFFAVKAGLALGIIFAIGPMLIMGDRKISAWIQGRKGPNRVGPWGMMQPVADILKLVMKEVIIPADVDRTLFLLGPLFVFIPPVFGFCVIPMGNQIDFTINGVNYTEKLQVASLNIGLLFIMSVLSVGVYGITLGGWASNNKYSLLGSLRASAQLISYELTLGLTLLLVVMMTGSIDLNEIVLHQAKHGWNVFGGLTWWGLPSGLIGFVLLFTCALAENNRLPFDMAECEAELVGGYHTEYSSMGFGMYMFSEYCAMILSASLLVTLFLGGWSMPYITNPDDHSILAGLVSLGVFLVKICIILFLYIQIRWTLPRFRYDQIMNLGWKTFLPLSLVNIGAMALIGVYLENH